MNLIDCYVLEIVSEPEFMYNKWFIDVKADGYGYIFESKLMFDTKEECLLVNIGYKFLA